jgi:hypothetical protein
MIQGSHYFGLFSQICGGKAWIAQKLTRVYHFDRKCLFRDAMKASMHLTAHTRAELLSNNVLILNMPASARGPSSHRIKGGEDLAVMHRSVSHVYEEIRSHVVLSLRDELRMDNMNFITASQFCPFVLIQLSFKAVYVRAIATGIFHVNAHSGLRIVAIYHAVVSAHALIIQYNIASIISTNGIAVPNAVFYPVKEFIFFESRHRTEQPPHFRVVIWSNRSCTYKRW